MRPNRVQEIDNEIQRLKIERVSAWEEAFLTCDYCHSKQKYKSTHPIISHQYIPPYSCSAGDYWSVSRITWECNHCGHQTNPLPDHSAIGMKEEKKLYEDRPLSKFSMTITLGSPKGKNESN